MGNHSSPAVKLFTMQLKSLFVFAFSPVLLFAQTTPAQIESDINVLVAALAAAIVAIDAFPIEGGTLDEAIAIHTADTGVNDGLVTVTNDITTASCPLSDTDASAILTLVEAQGPNIQQALMDAVAREPGLAAVGAVPIIRDDLTTLQASSDAMGAALVDCVSSNLASRAQAFQSAVDAAFAPAVAAFS
ncbi:hypothetical protein C0993_006810 [Termitomyces sp. T159_Od127]|nr:hypothetical protein C0993_006810 [Termitomyces sp. T159_Od127]